MRAPRLSSLPPWAVVGAVIGGNLWDLRSTTDPVAYLDDASIHEQMVRYAAASFRAGHVPLTGWFPYLGLGSPQFLHYQPLGAMLTGVFGLAAGGDAAFRWSLYLLLSLWPVVVYLSARLFRIPPWGAAAAAVVAPLLASVPLVGYERGSYVWIGYGLWSQLWAQWTLPLAWATTWRALEDRRFIAPAAVSIAATIAFHYETGYLAVLAVILLPWLRGPVRIRVGRALTVLAGAAAMSLWIVVPLLRFGRWASVNEALQNGPLVNGYGARTVLGWLFGGRVFDNGRFAVVSLAVAIGVVVTVAFWRSRPALDALLVMGVATLVLCFGRTTFGPLVDAVPGGHDLFFRRFMLGAQLAGIFLAGAGLLELGRVLRAAGLAVVRALSSRMEAAPLATTLSGVAAGVLCAAALIPAFVATHRYDQRNQALISLQRDVQVSQAAHLAPLLAYVRAHGDGRTYAGDPSNWGPDFTVGQVPVFKYLESQEIDEVGYTLRTASLMTQPEFNFDASNAADYALFGIRYLILPASQAPAVPATLVTRSGTYALWTLPTTGYFDVVDTVGTIAENRRDVGARTLSLLQSQQFAGHQDLTVAWAGAPAARPTAPGLDATTPVSAGAAAAPSPGDVLSQRDLPASGSFTTVVSMSRRAVVTLSASFDPGWRVYVDGRPAPTEMLAPAVVGVEVGPGTHEVLFRYVGYGGYGWLAGAAGAGLAGVVAASLLGWGQLSRSARRTARAMSRSASRSAMAARLS